MKKLWAISALIFLALPLAGFIFPESPDNGLPRLEITLKPAGLVSGTPGRLYVAMTISGLTAKAGEEFLQAPIVFASTKAAVYKDGDVTARDASGRLPLKMIEGPDDGQKFFHWRFFSAGRTSRGDMVLRYSAPIVPALSPRRPGPSYDLRGFAGGVGGAGAGFLILPKGMDRLFAVTWRWDLSELASGSRGVSTLGLGDVTAEKTFAQLMLAFFLAGPLSCHPEDAGNAPFNAFWMGTPNFDAPADAAWAAKAYAVLMKFFGETQLPPYYLLCRPHPNSRDGGAATTNGFFLEYGIPPQETSTRRIMFTHEMFHHFAGLLDGEPGTSSWYGEGLAEFFESWIPYRAGLISADELLKEVQKDLEGYYGNPRRDLPNDKIAAEYWKDSIVQNIPYLRGKAYFIDVNAKIRASSDGRRSLDDLLLAMLESRKKGTGCDKAKWLELIGTELGPSGLKDFENFMAGKLIVPPSDAFGPEFERVEYSLTPFVLGFPDRLLLDSPRIINGLVPGSAAAQAGLRDGDIVIEGDDIEKAKHDRSPVYHLKVKRGGEIVPISFSTQGAPVAAYKWIRK